MILNVCNFWTPGQINGKLPTYPNSSFANALWAPGVATELAHGHRHRRHPGRSCFKNVRRNLEMPTRAHPKAAGPGHWNDPDYLGPQLGMTAAEAQAQLTMWAIVAAPLILGSDPRKLSDGTVRMLENPRVLAVDQDRLGIQGTEIAARGAGEVWVKPLSGGRRALALLNTGSRSLTITTSAGPIRMAHATRYRVQNLVGTAGARWSGGTIAARGPPHSALLYVVSD